MINIENVAEIHRLFYVEHMKINAISVHLAIHRDAVKRALSPAKFCNKRFRASILDAWEPYIAETVEEYPKIKSPRLTELLRDRGYQGSTSSVRHYLQKYRQRHHQAFLRLEYFPGEQAQVDWADFGKINVDGGQRRLSCFVMVMAHSRAVFARFGYDQKLESFLHGHIQAFNYFNGVPRSLLYDNLKSAVIERQAGLIKFNNNLLELCAHYRFIPKACQPYAGNQKGRVERTIRYLRENFFEARKFADLADLNHQLDIWRENTAQARPWPQNKEKTVREAFSEEQGVLIPLPGCEPDASRMEVTRSGKTPYIYFDGNNYSIPHEFVLVPITLRISQKNIMFYDKDKKIATHERSWSKGKHIEDPIHIRALVEKKRVHQTYKNKSVLLARLPEAAALLPLWLELGNNIGKSSQRLMALLDQYQVEDVKNAIDQAIAVRSPSVDGITYLLQKSKIKPYKKTKIELSERLQRIDIRSHEPSQYDDLINQKESSDDRNSPATQK